MGRGVWEEGRSSSWCALFHLGGKQGSPSVPHKTLRESQETTAYLHTQGWLCGHVTCAGAQSPRLALIFWCWSLKILNFWTRSLAFPLCTGPHKLSSWSCPLDYHMATQWISSKKGRLTSAQEGQYRSLEKEQRGLSRCNKVICV